MNIFVIENDPINAAKSMCDKHVVKQALESCQMLCSPFDAGTAPYKRTHYNHPCTIWVRSSLQNYSWLILHCAGLFSEYTRRYGKIHECTKVLDWCMQNYIKLNLPNVGLTEHPICMADEFKLNDVVSSYRNYYIKAKSSFAKWKLGNVPTWFKVS
jgi:hypothetical protein